MAPHNPLDDLLLRLGTPGRLQVVLFILLCTNAFPITFNFIFITFFANIPPNTCNINGTGFNSEWIPASSDGRNEGFEQCLMYSDPQNHSLTQPCDNGHYFDLVGMENTIASEWDLTCDKKYMASLASTIFFAGVMIGGLIFGTIADKLGRQPVVLLTLYGQAVIGLGIYFVNDYILFVILKFFQGMLLQGLQASNNSLVMELFPLRYRTLAGMILSMCATSGHMILSLLLYLLPDWRKMQLTISLLTTVSVTYSWLYPESLRWLLSQRRHGKALILIKRIASVNKVKLPDNIEQQLKDISHEMMLKEESTKKYDFRDLFKTKNIRRYTLFLMFSWFSASSTYYGIQFYIPQMKGREYRYLNLFISGAMETTARVVGYFIIDRLGRRKPLVVFYVMSGLLCIATGIIADALKMDVIANVLAIIGKLCSAQCFAFILVFSSEIFPTVIRTIGLGFVACFTRIGSMLAPQILSLKNISSLSVPFVIFGSFSMISAILIWFLPETRGKPLPNVLEDVDNIKEPPRRNTNQDDNINFKEIPIRVKTPETNPSNQNGSVSRKPNPSDRQDEGALQNGNSALSKDKVDPENGNGAPSKDKVDLENNDTSSKDDGVVNESFAEENEVYNQRL